VLSIVPVRLVPLHFYLSSFDLFRPVLELDEIWSRLQWNQHALNDDDDDSVFRRYLTRAFADWCDQWIVEGRACSNDICVSRPIFILMLHDSNCQDP